MSATRRVVVSEVELAVSEAGAGGRPLVLIHGFAGAKEDFAGELGWLAETGWHCVAPDLRGHGASDQPDGQEWYSLELFARDDVGLVDALGWRRFVVLGHSMGGMVAQRVLVAVPDRVAALVLVDTSAGPPDGIARHLVAAGRRIVAAGGMPALLEAQRAAGSQLDTPAHRRLLVERPGYREFNDRKLLACAADMWLAMSDEILSQPDVAPTLASIPPVPALVVVGEQDAPFLEPSRRLAAALGARRVVVPDAGHSPQFENPVAWRAALESFLPEVDV